MKPVYSPRGLDAVPETSPGDRYLVTMRVLVHAKTDKKALNLLTPAAAKAMKVAVDGVALDVEEAPDE